MNESKCFTVIYNLCEINSKKKHGWYFKTPKIQYGVLLRTFKSIIESKLYKLYLHLISAGVDFEDLTQHWFNSMFVNVLPLNVSVVL